MQISPVWAKTPSKSSVLSLPTIAMNDKYHLHVKYIHSYFCLYVLLFRHLGALKLIGYVTGNQIVSTNQMKAFRVNVTTAVQPIKRLVRLGYYKDIHMKDGASGIMR